MEARRKSSNCGSDFAVKMFQKVAPMYQKIVPKAFRNLSGRSVAPAALMMIVLYIAGFGILMWKAITPQNSIIFSSLVMSEPVRGYFLEQYCSEIPITQTTELMVDDNGIWSDLPDFLYTNTQALKLVKFSRYSANQSSYEKHITNINKQIGRLNTRLQNYSLALGLVYLSTQKLVAANRTMELSFKIDWSYVFDTSKSMVYTQVGSTTSNLLLMPTAKPTARPSRGPTKMHVHRKLAVSEVGPSPTVDPSPSPITPDTTPSPTSPITPETTTPTSPITPDTTPSPTYWWPIDTTGGDGSWGSWPWGYSSWSPGYGYWWSPTSSSSSGSSWGSSWPSSWSSSESSYNSNSFYVEPPTAQGFPSRPPRSKPTRKRTFAPAPVKSGTSGFRNGALSSYGGSLVLSFSCDPTTQTDMRDFCYPVDNKYEGAVFSIRMNLDSLIRCVAVNKKMKTYNNKEDLAIIHSAKFSYSAYVQKTQNPSILLVSSKPKTSCYFVMEHPLLTKVIYLLPDINYQIQSCNDNCKVPGGRQCSNDLNLNLVLNVFQDMTDNVTWISEGRYNFKAYGSLVMNIDGSLGFINDNLYRVRTDGNSSCSPYLTPIASPTTTVNGITIDDNRPFTLIESYFNCTSKSRNSVQNALGASIATAKEGLLFGSIAVAVILMKIGLAKTSDGKSLKEFIQEASKEAKGGEGGGEADENEEEDGIQVNGQEPDTECGKIIIVNKAKSLTRVVPIAAR